MATMDLSRKVNQDDYSDIMPAYPAKTLVLHVANKGLQLGSVVGVFVLAPLNALFKTRSLSASFKRVPVASCLFFTVTTVGMLSFKSQEFSISDVDDRAYRIVHNKLSSKLDHAAFIGGAAGLTLTTILSRSISFLIPGTITGISLGCLCVLSQPLIEKYSHLIPIIPFKIEDSKN